jgi:amino acid adenylation domain-containing protein
MLTAEQLLDRIGQANSLVEAFENCVAQSPGAPAVAYGGTVLSYEQLNAWANRVARALIAGGATPARPVAIMIDRSIETIVAIVAVLKSGACFLPLDPATPPERLAHILRAGDPSMIVTAGGAIEPELAVMVAGLTQVSLAGDGSDDDPANPGIRQGRDAKAYIIFTSGSTGAPKGVAVTHGNVLRLFTACSDTFAFGPSDIWTLFHSYAFDFSVWEMWGALLFGGKLVVVPASVTRSPEDFHRLLVAEGVTVLNQTPTAFRQLINEDLSQASGPLQLRYIVFGGERLDFRMLRQWVDRHGDESPQLINMYGITETTVHVTARRVRGGELSETRSLIGSPLSDLTLLVRDELGAEAPRGTPGELLVCGPGLALGYVGQPEQTAERFITVSHPELGSVRAYRSGDLVRLTDGGDIEYLGRIDKQVKIRGFRIELGEIEAAVESFPGVKNAVAAALKPDRVIGSSGTDGNQGEDLYIAVYAVLDGGEIDLAGLHGHLLVRLPIYMMPTRLVVINSLPVNHNGKIDMAGLPDPLVDGLVFKASSTGAETSMERIWINIFRETLNVQDIGVDDGFFALGGDSIMAIRLRSRAKDLGVVATLADIYGLQTPRELARLSNQKASPAQG